LMESNGGFFRGSCLLLYGACFFGKVLDLSTTRVGLQLGAFEHNFVSRSLFALVGFNVTAAFDFVVVASFVAVSELMFWRVAKADVPGRLRILSNVVTLFVWLGVFASICVTVAGNLTILQQLGNPHLFLV